MGLLGDRLEMRGGDVDEFWRLCKIVEEEEKKKKSSRRQSGFKLRKKGGVVCSGCENSAAICCSVPRFGADPDNPFFMPLTRVFDLSIVFPHSTRYRHVWNTTGCLKTPLSVDFDRCPTTSQHARDVLPASEVRERRNSFSVIGPTFACECQIRLLHSGHTLFRQHLLPLQAIERWQCCGKV